jgi:hypothetical protein
VCFFLRFARLPACAWLLLSTFDFAAAVVAVPDFFDPAFVLLSFLPVYLVVVAADFDFAVVLIFPVHKLNYSACLHLSDLALKIAYML